MFYILAIIFLRINSKNIKHCFDTIKTLNKFYVTLTIIYIYLVPTEIKKCGSISVVVPYCSAANFCDGLVITCK